MTVWNFVLPTHTGHIFLSNVGYVSITGIDLYISSLLKLVAKVSNHGFKILCEISQGTFEISHKI